MAVALEEISEANAEGITRLIYGDIKAALRAPVVNLVYRHMATRPPTLFWAWSALRPNVRSGAVGGAISDVVAATDIPALPPISMADLANAGVSGETATSLVATLNGYNAANPINLMSLRLLQQMLHRGHRPSPLDEGALVIPAPSEIAPLPPIAPFEGMTADVRALLDALSEQLFGLGAAVPSIYRHFADDAGLLQLLLERQAPLAGRVATLSETLDAAARDAAIRLADAAETNPDGLAPPDAETLAAIDAVIDRFPPMIAGMVVVGAALRRALP